MRKTLAGPAVTLLIALCALGSGCGRAPEDETTATPDGAANLSGLEDTAGAGLSGTVVYEWGGEGRADLFTLDLATGVRKQLTSTSADESQPVWSPDGRWILFKSNRDGKYEIYKMKSDGSQISRLTSLDMARGDPCWFSDGKRIAYTGVPGGDKNKSRIYEMDLATKAESPLSPSGPRTLLPDVSPDGRWLTFTRYGSGYSVYKYEIASGDPVVRLTNDGAACRPHWSPDGRKIAYVTKSSDGRGDIWTMTSSGSNRVRLTTQSDREDYFPNWSPDGRWIVYASLGSSSGSKWRLRVISASTGSSTPISIGGSGGDERYPDWK